METANLTPLFQQYFNLKAAHPGCVMMMRVGDFYEAYGEDADLLARDAEITLTSKEAGGERIAMSGVPYFAVDQYLRAMVEKGHRVAIADQMEDARQARGLVRREVTRVVTAGTILDPQMLDDRQHNFLLCLAAHQGEVGLAAADVSTGEFACTELPAEAERVLEEAARYRPAEVVLGPGLGALGLPIESLAAARVELDNPPRPAAAEALVRKQFGLGSLQACDLVDRKAATLAAACLIRYLAVTQPCGADTTLSPPLGYCLADHMVLDATTRRNLELTETLLGRERKGSLLWALDHTCTAMGARRLRQWLLRPLLAPAAIDRRNGAVAALVSDYSLCARVRGLLEQVLDVERLLSRVVYQTANARDLAALRQSLEVLPELAAGVMGSHELLEALGDHLVGLEDLEALLGRALAQDPPLSVREGGLIAPGYSPELDELRGSRGSAREWIASLQERERERTGVKSLKVGFNQVFGYYLEVTKANLKLVPEDYIRKQTLANAERYFTPELKEYEARVLGAEDRIREVEYSLFTELRQQVAARASQLRAVARALSEIDVLTAFAEGAVRYDWVRPLVVEENLLEVEGGRHPVVERALESGFVPNDCRLDSEQRLVVLTGPNMSGKSTWLRQNALIAVMAQMGSFVPARAATVGISDRVFTRVGASDDLHLGQSTFMVEMSEAANILLHATPRSLVILDEVGRGTSTYDGLALARAIAEYLYNQVRAKTLFATHFHELTNLSRSHAGVRNYRVAVRENRDDIVFLHRIVPGGADRSYGIYVAKLAGVPGPVLDRARHLLLELERNSRRRSRSGNDGSGEQLALFGANGTTDWTEELMNLDLGSLSPEEALARLHGWKRGLEGGVRTPGGV